MCGSSSFSSGWVSGRTNLYARGSAWGRVRARVMVMVRARMRVVGMVTVMATVWAGLR